MTAACVRAVIGLAVLLCLPWTGALAAPAPAWVVVDAADGRVLAGQAAEQPRHPASLTKLMTLYLAFAALRDGTARLDQPVKVSARAAGQGGSVLGLAEGKTIALSDALAALVVRSANDAAVALAEHLAGSEADFARRMTEQAARLGMTATRFANATGLTAPDHVSSALDMARLGAALARDFPERYGLFALRSLRWNGATLPTVNGFLDRFPGAEGMKTGFTCPAGYNLVAAARRDGRRLIGAVLGETSRDGREQRMAALLRGTAPPSSPSAAAGGVPDLSAQVCGGGVMAAAKAPPGWALELSFSRNRSQAAHELEAVRRRLGARLGGGQAMIVTKPFDGGVRYRGLVVGLREDRAVATCLEMRKAEQECLVLTPAMLQGALEDESLFRRLAAR